MSATSFAKRYRIGDVPFYWKPAYYLYSLTLGLFLVFYNRLIQLTSRVHRQGKLPQGNAILCVWHENLTLYFCTHAWHRRHAWMNHPLWYMSPIWMMMWLSGIREQIGGSSGNDGKIAAEKVAAAVKAGKSTLLAPDGPEGPPRVMKQGILELSAATGVPIVPIRFEYSGKLRMRSWDRKKIALPFGRIEVIYGEPIRVERGLLEPARFRITSLL